MPDIEPPLSAAFLNRLHSTYLCGMENFMRNLHLFLASFNVLVWEVKCSLWVIRCPFYLAVNVNKVDQLLRFIAVPCHFALFISEGQLKTKQHEG